MPSVAFAVLSAFVLVQSQAASNDCAEKETCLAFLDLTGDAIMKAMDFIPDCLDNATAVDSHSSTCGQREKTISYLNVALSLIERTRDQFPNCQFRNDSEPGVRPDSASFPRNCHEVQSRGDRSSGVYTIWPRGVVNESDSLDVYCDMDTDGGGWTVIQRRGNFSYLEDFFRVWDDYKHGFGNVTEEFWIGNDNIFVLTNDNRTEVRFDLRDVDGERRHAVYSPFRVDGEDSLYRLHVGNYTGNAGDALTFSDGMPFSTRDRCHDRRFGPPDCALQNRSGWWFRDCTLANPNGVLRPGRSGVTGVYWNEWKLWECLAEVEIKVRTVGWS